MKEQWKVIEGYNGNYLVSNLGNVHSVIRQLTLKPTLKKNTGYMQVGLYGQDGHKSELVHRLVACAFLNKHEGANYVNHIDGDKSNNYVSNLHWCTHGENQSHAIRTGLIKLRRGVDVKASKLTDEKVRDILDMLRDGATQSKCAEIMGVNQQTISKIVNGVSWKHITNPSMVIMRDDYGQGPSTATKRSDRPTLISCRPHSLGNKIRIVRP